MIGFDARALRALGVALSLTVSGMVSGAALAADDPVVAKVDGAEIHRSEVMAAYEGSPFQSQPIEQVFNQVVDYVVTTRLLAAEADKNKLGDDADVKVELASARNAIMAQAYLAKRTQNVVSPDDVKKKYDELVKASPPKDELHLFHAVAKTEDDAKKIIADLKGGTKLADEIKAKSTDDDAKTNGGDLGFFSEEELQGIPQLGEAASKLKPGQYTEAPIETQFGWQILAVTETRPAAPPSLDDTKQAITQSLRQDAARKVVADLTTGAQIQKFDQNGKPLPPPSAAPAAAPAPAPAK